jgi:hypothetical protein
MKRYFTSALFMPVKPLATAPGPLKGATVHDQTNPLIQLVDISSILCEL